MPVVPREIQEWIIIDSNRGTISVNSSFVMMLEMTDDGEQVREEIFFKDLPEHAESIKLFQKKLLKPYKEEYERVNEI